ncbi:MAG TPA: methyltransferase domain-containing protein [Thermoanaerobaculia bacterium]|jgi:ubiquinone/menaquinone biosynthesis C-methylase UbiE|nr:methyltransferase domain-containing protein [Thermoanaerobaculia bacterium]
MADAPTFAGSVPEKYDRYMAPIFFDPYAEDLVSRLPVLPEMRVLELACGTGVVTRRLRDALPEARIVATDLNEPMLDTARARFSAAERIEWHRADATGLPFGDEAFDAVVCQFGVMFFSDKLAAFREAHRVLAPGGSFLFNVWDAMERNELSLTVHQALASLFPSDPPDFYRIPFGFHDSATISAMLGEAGFEEVQVTSVSRPGVSRSAHDAAIALVEGTPVLGQVLARGQVNVSAVVHAVTGKIRERFGEPVQSTMTALVCSGRKRT